MRNFILRRLFLGIFIVVFGALLVYTVIRSLPSSYVETIARQRASNPLSTKSYQEWLDQLNEVYGLNEGIIPGFIEWGGNAIRGDFGESWHYGVPVTEKFSEVIGVSLVVNVITFFVQILIAIPLGILAARKQYSPTDYAITIFALMGISLPTFFLATILKYVFSIQLGWFPLYGLTGRFYTTMTPFEQLIDQAYHMVLPIVTLTMLSVGGLMRYTRTNMLEVLNSDYIRTARAKGLRERLVVVRHGLKGGLLPVVSYLGPAAASVLTGSVVIETIFGIPGIGRYFVQGALNRDYTLVLGVMITYAVLIISLNLIVDMIYGLLDPKIRSDYR